MSIWQKLFGKKAEIDYSQPLPAPTLASVLESSMAEPARKPRMKRRVPVKKKPGTSRKRSRR